MARGITSFSDYYKRHTPGGAVYGCCFCTWRFQSQGGNALARHSKSVARVKKHVEEKHPETTPQPKEK